MKSVIFNGLLENKVVCEGFFAKIGESFSKVIELAKSNWIFLLICAAVVASFIIISVIIEVLIAKKTGIPRRSDKLKVKRMVLIAMFSALAVVLMLFRFPVWFAPGFYKMDFSEIPVLIAALALGPVAGITTEFIKILLNLLLNSTDSAFVGELANFLMGCAFVIPASAIYFGKKSRKRALAGLIFGTFFAAIIGGILNAYLLLPKYAEVYGMDIASFVTMGAEKNAAVSNLPTFILCAVIPFNLMKFALVSLVVALIYKYISRLIKEQ